ncbi:MAG: extracellular solute-binding protein [Clostridia bacterium]|nr:extracellular solute-binding protein [Clostridia bacterium]
MKKIIAVLLLVAMAIGMVACGGNKPSSNPGNNNGGNNTTAEKVRWEVPVEGFDTEEEITITFSHTMGKNLSTVLDRYIAKFNEIFPNITVEHYQIGGYDEVRDQTNKQLTAGNQPNIAYCYPDHVALYNVTKKVIPLDNLIESTIEVQKADGTTMILGLTDEQKADFIQTYYNEGTAFDAAGTMYTMPLSKSTEALFYNKTFFEAHNLTVPTTWEEMEAVCKQIKEILAADDKAANDTDIPLGYDSEANWFITMTEQYGSPYTSTDKNDHFLFNNKTNRDFVKWFREWYQKGYVTTKELYGAYTSKLFTNTDPTKPSCYMCIGSTGGASNQIPIGEDDSFPFEVGVAPIPQVNPENPKAISQGPSLCIFSQAGDKDAYEDSQEVLASWIFVKYLCTTPEFQAAFSMTSGYMPVINSAKEMGQYANWLQNANSTGNLVATVANLAFEQAEAAFVSPAFNGSTKARDQVGALIQYCFTNTSTDVDAMILKAFQDAITECLSNN